ncbi:MAG: flagellar protein FlgN [Acidimicrobiia bacterium]
MTELSHTMWRQRRLMELLMYRLEVQQLVLASGRTQWLGNAATEVEQVIDAMRKEELKRAVHSSAAGAALGLGVEPSLRELIEAAPSPWDEILREHQAAFLTMTGEIEDLSKQNRDLISRGHQATRDLLAAITGEVVDSYSASGTAQRIGQPARTMDWNA